MSDKAGQQLAQLAPKIMGAFHDLGQQHPKGEHLSMRQYQALIIVHANGKLSLKSFCEKLALAPSTGTELANRMIELGFICKVGEEEDRRQAFLTVSEKGLELMRQRQEALTEMFTRFLAPFSEQDRQEFVNSFDTIWKIIQRYSAQKK